MDVGAVSIRRDPRKSTMCDMQSERSSAKLGSCVQYNIQNKTKQNKQTNKQASKSKKINFRPYVRSVLLHNIKH